MPIIETHIQNLPAYLFLFLQTIGAEIAAHEVTVEEMKRRNVTNLPPPSAEGKAARGGTMLDQLQVTLTPTGQCWELFVPPIIFCYIIKTIFFWCLEIWKTLEMCDFADIWSDLCRGNWGRSPQSTSCFRSRQILSSACWTANEFWTVLRLSYLFCMLKMWNQR